MIHPFPILLPHRLQPYAEYSIATWSVERTWRHTAEWQPNQQLRGGVEPALWSAGRAPASVYMASDWHAASRCSWSPYDDLAPSPGKPWQQTAATCDSAAPKTSLCVMSGIPRQKAYHRRLFIRRRGADSVTTLTWLNSIYFCLWATVTSATFMWTNYNCNSSPCGANWTVALL